MLPPSPRPPTVASTGHDDGGQQHAKHAPGAAGQRRRGREQAADWKELRTDRGFTATWRNWPVNVLYALAANCTEIQGRGKRPFHIYLYCTYSECSPRVLPDAEALLQLAALLLVQASAPLRPSRASLAASTHAPWVL